MKIKMALILYLLSNIFINKIMYSQVNNLNCKKANKISRIVVAGGSITEIIYLLNQEDKIAALDVTSVYPKKTKEKTSIGYVRNLSTEGILSVSPDLILGEDDMGPPSIIKQLQELSLDVRVINEIQTAEGIVEKIRCIGEIMNLKNECEIIITQKLYPKIEELNKIKSNKKVEKKKIMLVLSMNGSSPIVAGANTSGDSFIKMIGGKNIYESIEGWQTVSEESIINYNPDFIILPQKELHKNSNVNNIISNPIFSNTIAGKENNFILDDGMAILGFGPRTINSALKAAKIINSDIE
tara:strand:- start:77 stop:967 length:891 start_codon:yes stop_codon:yes gene_type:complete